MKIQYRIVGTINNSILEHMTNWYDMDKMSVHAVDDFVKQLAETHYNVRIEYREVD